MSARTPILTLTIALTAWLAACVDTPRATPTLDSRFATQRAELQATETAAAAVAGTPTIDSVFATYQAAVRATFTAAATPEVTPTPTPPAPGMEAILILEPGNGSAVVSPVRVAGEAEPVFEQTLLIIVTGADGTELGRTTIILDAPTGERGPFEGTVDFATAGDQPGRLSVAALSPRDGSLVHLASVEVDLLASGKATVRPAPSHPEDISIFEPLKGATINGGVIHVTGRAAPVFENRLAVAVCGQGGSGAPDPICGTADNLLGRGTVVVEAGESGQPGSFAGEVTYSAPGLIAGSIVVYSLSPRDGGVTHAASVNVILAP